MCHVLEINICLLRNSFNFNLNPSVGLKIEHTRSVLDTKRSMDSIVTVNHKMVAKTKKVVAGFKMQWMLELITYFFINCRLHFINLNIIRQIILDHASSCQVWNFLSLILDLSKTGILILKFFYYELALHHISVK